MLNAICLFCSRAAEPLHLLLWDMNYETFLDHKIKAHFALMHYKHL